MSTILRSSTICHAAVCLLAIAAFAGSAIADDDAPLQLGSEHVGLTSEGIAVAESEATTERLVDDAIEKSEWTDDDLAEEPACMCPDAVLHDTAGVETRIDGANDYVSCVEVAIRSGNGFKASSSVCEALFPEARASAGATPDVSAAPPAPVEDLSAAATTY